MSTHEVLEHKAVEPPSPRSTGFVFAGVAVLVAISLRDSPRPAGLALAIALMLGLVGWLKPTLLQPINLLWFKLSMLLSKVVTPVVMLAIFVIAFIPAGFLMRLRSDPLGARKKPRGASYWIHRPPADPSASMSNQF